MTESTPVDRQTEAELQRRIAEGSQNLGDYRNLADLLISAGRGEEAVTLYQRALDLPLTNVQKARASMELGWIFYDVMGKQAQALPLAQSALSLLSNERETPEVLLLRGSGQSLFAHCMWFTDTKSGAEAARGALEWLERVIVESPDFEEVTVAYSDAARLHNLLGNTEKAIALCRKMLDRELNKQDRLSCLIVLGEALRCERRFTEAEQVIEEALRYAEASEGRLPLLYFTRGLIQRGAKRPAEAQGSLDQALAALRARFTLRNDSDFLTEIHWNLAELYYESEKYSEAAASFQIVLTHLPVDHPYRSYALLSLGHCYLATGAHAAAREYYKQVLTLPHSSLDEKSSARKGLECLSPRKKRWFHFLLPTKKAR